MTEKCAVAGKNGVKWAYSPLLAPYVTHGFTQRHGGVSGGAFSSLNLGWNRPEPKENIRENYGRLCIAAGFEYASMTLVSYEHGVNVCRVDAGDRGKGFDNGALPPCDAIMTDDPRVTLITLHADCMPIALCDPEHNACAAIHAGWKGCLGRIAQRCALSMAQEFGSRPERLLAWVGPSISPRRFEVDEDVMRLFLGGFGDTVISGPDDVGKYRIDLWRAMESQLEEAGLESGNIQLSGVCTYDNADDYFSYRREKRVSGAMALFVKLNGTSDNRR